MAKFFGVICNVFKVVMANETHFPPRCLPPTYEFITKPVRQLWCFSVFYSILSFFGHANSHNIVGQTEYKHHPVHKPPTPRKSQDEYKWPTKGIHDSRMNIYPSIFYFINERSTFYWKCFAMWKIFRRIISLWSRILCVSVERMKRIYFACHWYAYESELNQDFIIFGHRDQTSMDVWVSG